MPRTADGIPLCGPARVEHAFTHPIFHYRSASLDAFATDLEKTLGQVVMVSPPVRGSFDIDFVTPEGYTAAVKDPDIDAFRDAIEDQLGARTEIRTTPVGILTITDVERPRLGV